MKTWLATMRAVLVGAFKHPHTTTVVVLDERTGRVATWEER